MAKGNSRTGNRGFRTRLLFLTCMAAGAALLPAPALAVHQMIRVLTPNKAEFLRLEELAGEVRDCGVIVSDEDVTFAAEESRVRELRELGFQVELVQPDLERFYLARLKSEGRAEDYGGYHTYETAIAAMDALVEAHPEVMLPRMSIGRTIEGRDLWVYKISAQPEIEIGKPEVFFNAYTHAREAITFEIVYDLAKTLAQGYGHDPRITRLLDTRAVWIEPVVNPDGVEYNAAHRPEGGGQWRKNRRANPDGSFGVDLNRNFGFQWGVDELGSSSSPGSELYRGPDAFSEPETRALSDFLASHRFTIAVNYHSFAQLRLFPWGHTPVHSPDYDEMLRLLRPPPGTTYYPAGAAWEILYFVNGDAGDWMYGDQRTKPKILTFTPEVGRDSDGFWPIPSRIPALIAENREVNLRVIELADNPGRVMPPNVSVIAAPDSAGRSFVLSWTEPEPDPDNPAVRWNLMQGTGHTIGTDRMEADPWSRWTTDGWRQSGVREHSGEFSLHSGHSAGRNTILMARRGYLVGPGDQLKFWTWYAIEGGRDYGYVEVSTDARSFVPIPGTITTDDSPFGRNIGNGITAHTEEWVQAVFDLSAYEGKVIWLRFRYTTDRTGNSEGWYIDDLEPAHLFTSETLVAGSLAAAQYRFINHSEGRHTFMVQAVDAEGDSAIWGPPKDLIVAGPADSIPDEVPAAWSGLALAGPNPFFDKARIRFTVPSAGRTGEPILLRVFDVSGRALAEILRAEVGSAAEPGTTVDREWDPGDLPSGLYLARLEVGNRSSVQRLVYLEKTGGPGE